VCSSTVSNENIADSGSGLIYRAYPIQPTTSFTAKYLGVGIGGGYPDSVSIFDSTLGSWSVVGYTPSSGQLPNSKLATSTIFDVFFNDTFSDTQGNQYSQHPGSDSTMPGFQAYLGESGVSFTANNIYWIVVKYSRVGVTNTRCNDMLGTNPGQFYVPTNPTTQQALPYTNSIIGNGYAYELMSNDGVAWQPSNMIGGGVCNTFLAN
jgi:hypothetical protein